MKAYILVMQECTPLHSKNVHSCYVKVYILIMQEAALNIKLIILVDFLLQYSVKIYWLFVSLCKLL